MKRMFSSRKLIELKQDTWTSYSGCGTGRGLTVVSALPTHIPQSDWLVGENVMLSGSKSHCRADGTHSQS
jgi:hypothetical protein